MQRDLISIHNLSPADIWRIFALARKLKKKPLQNLLRGKSLAMIFEKPSTRTRVSFEVGMFELGGTTIHLSPRAVQLGVRESISDVAQTLSRYVDGVMLRTFSHQDLVEFARCSTVPVINGLSDLSHPCQALADMFTIIEKGPITARGGREGKGRKTLKVAYIGDGNNVCHSLMLICAKMGVDMAVAVPRGYEPKKLITQLAETDAKQSGAKVIVGNDPQTAVKDAAVVYTDVWTSMGQEEETLARKKVFKDFQVNQALIKQARKDALIMHCLPAHRGEEITAEVIDGPNAVIFDQAENRLHVQKAVLALLLGGKR